MADCPKCKVLGPPSRGSCRICGRMSVEYDLRYGRLAEVMPSDIAELQAKWERRHAVRRAFLSGAKQREIAEHLGVSKSRVGQYVATAERELRHKVMSPLERYLAAGPLLDYVEEYNRRLRAKLRRSELVIWPNSWR